MEQQLDIIKHKLAEFGINISDCTIETAYVLSGKVGRENVFVFPLKVHDNLLLIGQSGCINVVESESIVSLVQLPLLWGTVRIVNPLAKKIPFLLIKRK